MAEKVLALLVAFLGGSVSTYFLGAKLIGLALRHSPSLRAQMRAALDRADVRAEAEPWRDEIVEGISAEQRCEAYNQSTGERCPHVAIRQVPDLMGRLRRACREHSKMES